MPTQTQASLFDDEPPQASSVIQVLGGRKPADKAQAAFHRLVTQLERKRESLRAWQAYTGRFNQRLAAELMPLRQEFRQAQRQMAFLFDEAHRANALRGKQQKAKLSRMIVDLARGLLRESADAELEALHDRHSEITHADSLEEELGFSQAMIENMTGIDLGEAHGARNLDELFAHAKREMRANSAPAQGEEPPRRKSRRNPKTEAAEQKRAQAAKEVSQTVRDVYRKLASALHPDRESDTAQRVRKTEQMQRVNQAYEARDLLTLLNLQLEIEQIDAAQISALPHERLAHYNQVLREQLAELEVEIQAVVMPFRMAAQFSPYAVLTPEQVDRTLSADIARLHLDVRLVKANLADFREPARLARFLKSYRPEASREDELIELAALAEAFGSPKRS